jgi:hypothetical protein
MARSASTSEFNEIICGYISLNYTYVNHPVELVCCQVAVTVYL